MRFWSACLGNLFEHYDAALFGFLSPFLAPLIFPQQEPITALIMTYAMIPLGMLARPFGALLFGYIGDAYGRKQALFFSLSGMALVSAAMATIPTFQQVGFWAPLLFCAGRLIQNFLAAGENMGGAIFLLENAPEKRRDLLSSLYNASTIGGILLASAGVAMLGEKWRYLYLFGCITALFGCWIRGHLPPLEKRPSPFSNLAKTLWQERRALCAIAITAGFSYANYSLSLVLMNGFIPLITNISKAKMAGFNTLLLILDFAALPLFGYLSSKISREKLMLGAAFGAALSAIPLFSLLQGASLPCVIAIRICLVLFGVAFFAPFHAWAQTLVPVAHRYAVISFGYALGSQLFGGPAAAVSLWLFKTTGLVSSVAWYWMALALAAGLTLVKMNRFVEKTV